MGTRVEIAGHKFHRRRAIKLTAGEKALVRAEAGVVLRLAKDS
jgi:hypothetical protein